MTGQEANSQAFSSLVAQQAIANMRFITNAAPAIAQAIQLGDTQVNLMTYANCNLTNLMNYYQGLGYQFGFPEAVYGFFSFQSIPKPPTRVVISWSLPSNPLPSQVVSNLTLGSYTISVNNELVYVENNSNVGLPINPQDGWVETVNCDASGISVQVFGNGHNINGSTDPIVLTAKNSSATFIFTQGYGWSTFPNP